jgi:hypothetical protein
MVLYPLALHKLGISNKVKSYQSLAKAVWDLGKVATKGTLQPKKVENKETRWTIDEFEEVGNQMKLEKLGLNLGKLE